MNANAEMNRYFNPLPPEEQNVNLMPTPSEDVRDLWEYMKTVKLFELQQTWSARQIWAYTMYCRSCIYFWICLCQPRRAYKVALHLHLLQRLRDQCKATSEPSTPFYEVDEEKKDYSPPRGKPVT